MRFRNIQFSAPEADRKVMVRVSFGFMILLWALCISVLTFIGFAAFTNDGFVWDAKNYIIVAGLLLLSLVFIPIQLLRYLREMRGAP